VVVATRPTVRQAAALITWTAVGQGRSAFAVVKLRHDETEDKHRQHWTR